MIKQDSWFRVTSLALAICFFGSLILLSGCTKEPAASTTPKKTTAASQDNTAAKSTTPKKGPKRNKIKALAGGEEDGPSRGFQGN